MLDWNEKRKMDADSMKRREEAYFAKVNRDNDSKRRDKEDALAEYFR